LILIAIARDDNQGVDPIMGNAMDLMTQQGIPGIPGSHPSHLPPGEQIYTLSLSLSLPLYLFFSLSLNTPNNLRTQSPHWEIDTLQIFCDVTLLE
jgi:hypothetical protein